MSRGRVLRTLLAIVLFAGSTHALDPTLPRARRWGAPRGASAMTRLDAARSGRTPRLPRAPRLAWRRRLGGTLSPGLRVDASRHVIVATTDGELAELGPEGQSLWTRRLAAAVASEIALTTDGLRAALCADGVVRALDARGREVWTRALGAPGNDGADLLPTADGGLVLSWTPARNHLTRLDASGNVMWQVRVSGRIVGSAASAHEIAFLASDGGILSARGSAPPRPVGALEEGPGRPLIVGRTLYAVVGDAIESFDFIKGASARFAALDGVVVSEPLAATRGGELVALGPDRWLTWGRDGASKGQHTLPERPQVSGSALEPGESGVRWLLDDAGSVALQRSGNDVLLAVRDQEPVVVTSSGCPDPIALEPLGPGALLVACRTGLLLAFDDRAQ